MDKKSLMIGFFLAVVVFLLIGAISSGDVGRYKLHDTSNPQSLLIMDTQEGTVTNIVTLVGDADKTVVRVVKITLDGEKTESLVK